MPAMPGWCFNDRWIFAGRQVLSAATGVKLVDDPSANQYPMPLTATGEYDVEVRAWWKRMVFWGGNAMGLGVLACMRKTMK